MKKIFFAFIFFFFTLQGYAGYDVRLYPASVDPGNIFIDSGGYEEVISPLQGFDSKYTFDPYGENRVYMCKQIAISAGMIECRSDAAGYPRIFPIGTLPYLIFDDREDLNPLPWTGVLPPSTAPTMVGMVGNTSSGSIAAAGDIIATPFGSIVYFIIGIALLSVAIGVIFWISRKG